MHDSVIFFTEVECIGNIQIIHMEETKNRQRVIRLMATVIYVIYLESWKSFSVENDSALSLIIFLIPITRLHLSFVAL